MSKEYLGDGAYIEYDGYVYSLTTEDDIGTINIIFLEPEVLDRLRSDTAKTESKD